MNKGELIDAVHGKLDGATKKEVGAILEAFLDTITERVAAGEKVVLAGFGVFEPRERGEKQGRNPATGEALTIPATRVPAFSSGKTFKERVAAK